jgi:hypothetical protein
MIHVPNLSEDYQFVKRSIEHVNNKSFHYLSINNLIAIFASKWKDKEPVKENSAYQFLLHSLNLSLKKSFR